MALLRNLLWVDCLAAAVVGAAGLSFSGWLSRLLTLPQGLVVGFAVANLLYASLSGSLAVRPRRPPALIRLLVVANAAWALWCFVALAWFAGQASWLGLAYLGAEGVFVGVLAALEWSQRARLATAARRDVEGTAPS